MRPAVLALLAALLLAGSLSAQTNPPAAPAAPAAAIDPARYAIPETDEGLPGIGPIRRYDWFKKLWLERRIRWAGRDPGAGT